ncbi:hypothetical protein [Brevundimonas diminuta]|uniref:hypothetical protein n=1 Tax=Brevundimonas diminuta TaxID=293 RepID=UPI0030F6AADD
MIADTLIDFAPLPWTPVLTKARREWGLTVLCADGENLADRPMDRDEARFLCALHAFAPLAMIYVEQAAAKGGAEAQRLLAAFRHAATTEPTPETVVAVRRGRL